MFWYYNKGKTLLCDIKMEHILIVWPPLQGQRGLPGEQGFKGLPGPIVSDIYLFIIFLKRFRLKSSIWFAFQGPKGDPGPTGEPGHVGDPVISYFITLT